MIRTLVLSPKFMPSCMIALAALASFRCLLSADVGRTIYWACAAGLNYSITFLIK